MIYRLALRDEILALRAEVLRPNLPVESAQFAEDACSDCFHFGAFSDMGCQACLSIFPAPWNDLPAWQLRGMAVAAARRGSGVGATLLELAVDFVVKRGGTTLFWCNARISAVGFYEQAGWLTSGEPFEVPAIGPHIRMWRPL